MGLSPTELFPLDEAVTSLDARNPPDVGDATCFARSVDRTAAVVRGHLDFRCLSALRAGMGRSPVFRVWHLAGVRLPRRRC